MEIPGSAVGPPSAIGKDLLRAGPCKSLAAWLLLSYETPPVTSPPASEAKAAEGAAALVSCPSSLVGQDVILEVSSS